MTLINILKLLPFSVDSIKGVEYSQKKKDKKTLDLRDKI